MYIIRDKNRKKKEKIVTFNKIRKHIIRDKNRKKIENSNSLQNP